MELVVVEEELQSVEVIIDKVIERVVLYVVVVVVEL
jgi:hypothetical protein